MAATGLSIVIIGCVYDSVAGDFAVDWISDTNDAYYGQPYGGRTHFAITETLATINLRIVNDAKAYHNESESAGLGLLTPVKLFGGLVGL